MNQVPSGSRLFLDTNILLYAITEHPRFGPWCDALLDRIRQEDVAGYISVIVLNELIHKLIIGEVAQKAGLKPGQVIQYLKRHRKVLEDLEAYEVLAEVGNSLWSCHPGSNARDFLDSPPVDASLSAVIERCTPSGSDAESRSQGPGDERCRL